MRALIQRVTKGSVRVGERITGSIDVGLVILVGVTHNDTEKDAEFLAAKCANLRIFSDEGGKSNLSLLDVEGKALVVSQFTLYGDARKGRRPSFIDAARPEISMPLYQSFIRYLESLGVEVQSGEFGAMMHVEIYNDGPVTLMLESNA